MNGPNDNRSDKEKALDRLISEADQEVSGTFSRPSDECIHAYLTNDATEIQNALMWKALDASPAFRNEILEMADEVDLFARRDTSGQAARMELNEVPVRVLRLAEKREWYRSVRILAPIAAAALLVFVIVQSLKETNLPIPPDATIRLANLELFNPNVDPGLLVSMETRDPNSPKPTKIFSSADSAALSEFRYLLAYEGGEFKFLPEVPQLVADKNTRTVQLKIQDDTGKIFKEFTAVIPKSDTANAPVEAWILNLPDRSLYKVNMTQDTVSVKVDQQQISKGCITFTYGSDKWSKSIFGFIYNFEEAR